MVAPIVVKIKTASQSSCSTEGLIFDFHLFIDMFLYINKDTVVILVCCFHVCNRTISWVLDVIDIVIDDKLMKIVF